MYSKYKIIVYSICITVICVALFLLQYDNIKRFLRNYLTIKSYSETCSADAMYLLGGSAGALYQHISTAAELYKNGSAKKILIFSSIAKDEYDPTLRRNLTKNEWVRKVLLQNGINASDIDTVDVNEGFFGTLSEARDVVKYLKTKHYSSVILISSPCHSRRVSLSFDHFLENTGIRECFKASNDQFYMRELIIEFIKVQIYKILIKLE